jgi:hypothetical protein
MTTSEEEGGARAWGVHPGAWEEDVWGFVQRAWKTLSISPSIKKEDPITRLLFDALYELLNAPGDTDWWVQVQMEKWDPRGELTGRTDFSFFSPGPAPRGRHYTIECKRLNIATSKKRPRIRSNADQYVVNGMIRFLNGQYAAEMPCGGMLGYVMDGKTKAARAALEAEVSKRAATLSFSGASRFQPASFLPNAPSGGLTQHNRNGEAFTLHHLLFDVA